jgi:hypothetical protein
MSRTWLKVRGQAAGITTPPALLIYYSGHFFLTSRSENAIFQDLRELVFFRSFFNDTRFLVLA